MRDGNPITPRQRCESRTRYELTYEGWKLQTKGDLASTLKGYELTYEGWKLSSRIVQVFSPDRYELTYEGWKHEIELLVVEGALLGTSLPMRDGNRT